MRPLHERRPTKAIAPFAMAKSTDLSPFEINATWSDSIVQNGSRIGPRSFGGLGYDQVAAPKSFQFSPAYSCSIERKAAIFTTLNARASYTPKGLAGLRIKGLPVDFMAVHQGRTKRFSS